jgi:hypothetical protein
MAAGCFVVFRDHAFQRSLDRRFAYGLHPLLVRFIEKSCVLKQALHARTSRLHRFIFAAQHKKAYLVTVVFVTFEDCGSMHPLASIQKKSLQPSYLLTAVSRCLACTSTPTSFIYVKTHCKEHFFVFYKKSL